MKKILITGALHDVALNRFKQEKELQVDYKPDLPRAEILSIIGEYDCILSRSETDIDQELIDNGKKLSVIARAAVGIGNIDVEYATKKGILVFNTPAKNTNSAAELTVLLLLAVVRNLTTAHQSMADNKWNRHNFTGTELLNKTVGIIGLGNVGHRVAKFLHGFDCDLLVYDPYVSEEICRSHHAKKVEYEELIQNSDVITLHVPKNASTINMIDEKEIEMMKQGAIVINAARGGVINEDALAKGLESGKIAGAGIDTWDVEPVVEHPLKKFESVVMTPHIGASTLEAQKRIGETVAEETVKALQGKIVNTPVNLPKMRVLEGSLVSKYSVLAEKLGSFSQQFLSQEGKDFNPEHFDFLFRGKLEKDDWTLIKISYIKGFLKGSEDGGVSYVNAMQLAENKGFNFKEQEDKDFSDYESAIRVEIKGSGGIFTIGGTVFGKEEIRLSYLNGYVFEVKPAGNILVLENHDTPGVIGHIGMILGQHGVNINQFELSRKEKGGTAFALIMIDDEISEETLQALESHPAILRIRPIAI
ncbi:MAG: D-3-phosphoglycerate dehydrogenase [bacterium]|jgi:D-3-phosphoglycerate dehydrogenase